MHNAGVIGQFNDSYAPIPDGVARVVQEYAGWLNKSQAPTCVVTTSAPGYRDTDPFPVYRYLSLPTVVRPPYRFGLPWIDLAFWRRMRAMDFRLVHAHCPFAAGQVAMSLARERKITIVASFHTKYQADFERCFPKGVVDWAIRKVVKFYEAADQVWTPGRRIGRTRSARDGYRGKIEIMPNGSDVYLPAIERPRLAADADRELGTKPDEVVFLFVGQMVLEKNIRLLIESMGHLRREGLKSRLFFVGDGYARREMEDLVREQQLGELVRFLGVVQDRDRMKRLYARATLFLFPSQYDTGSLAMREAAGSGVPSLLVTPSTVAEVVRDGRNGFLAANDAESYAARIREIVARPALVARCGEEAQETIYRSWKKIVADVGARYDEILHAGHYRAAA